MAKILLVDDDKTVSNAVAEVLEASQHVVEQVHNGEDALFRLKSYEYDLVILDWGLPGVAGVDVLKEYRANGGSSPVIMMTGKAHIADKEAGFDSGADDYLTKPFSLRELTLRVRALMRRPSEFQEEVLTVRDLKLDLKTYQAFRGGQEIKLLPKEFALLEFLLRRKNQVFDVNELLDRVWSSESDSSEDAVRQCVIRLRKKIDRDGEPSIVSTIKGLGYKVEE
jgi:two-component system OmpR family response regulator